jgi:putative transcriptional regulator
VTPPLPFPELLQQLRMRLGLSQEEFAEELQVSFTTVNRWLNGRATPHRALRTIATYIHSLGPEFKDLRFDAGRVTPTRWRTPVLAKDAAPGAALALHIRIEWDQNDPEGECKALALLRTMLLPVVPPAKLPAILALFEKTGAGEFKFKAQ